MRYSIFLPKSKCIYDDNRRESDTRLVKKLGIRATYLSIIVFFYPCSVESKILTSPYTYT